MMLLACGSAVVLREALPCLLALQCPLRLAKAYPGLWSLQLLPSGWSVSWGAWSEQGSERHE